MKHNTFHFYDETAEKYPKVVIPAKAGIPAFTKVSAGKQCRQSMFIHRLVRQSLGDGGSFSVGGDSRWSLPSTTIGGGNDRRRIFSWFIILSLLMPLVALAADPDPAPVNTVLTNFLTLLTVVIQILILSAIVVFGWGVVTLMFAARSGDAKKIGEAKYIILWGIIGIFVLASMGGILAFIKTYIGVPNNSPIPVPTFTTFGSSSRI